jgi:hypothetical protein
MKKAVLPLLLLLLALPTLLSRHAWEEGGKTVTLCLDAAELEAFFPGDALPPALARLSAAGVRSVAVTGLDRAELQNAVDRWLPRLPSGTTLTLRPAFDKVSDGGRPWTAADISGFPPAARYLLPAGTALPLPGAGSPLEEALASGDRLFPLVEFSRAPALAALARRFPARVLRAHSLDEDEILKVTPARALSRFRRAARERGARFLYVRLFPALSPAANLDYVENLSTTLARSGFLLGEAASRFATPGEPFPSPLGRRWSEGPDEGKLPHENIPLRQAAAFLLAVLGPWLSFRLFRRSAAPAWSLPILLSLSALATGLLVAAALSSPSFLLGLASFRGVKAAMALPFLLVAAELYRRDERAAFLRRPVTWGAAAVGAAVLGAALVYLLRTGHTSGLETSALESRIREFLETLFGVRPRFKEFAVGHPLLWLAAFSAAKRDARWLWLAGLTAPLSIVNTFCHPHIPLDVSLLRVLHGLWLGALLGALAVVARRRFSPSPLGGGPGRGASR